MTKHRNEPMVTTREMAQPAAKPKATTVRRLGSVRGIGLSDSSAAAIPAGEQAEVDYFRRSRDTAAEGFKRVRGTRPTGRG
jgi:hypothetical protein